MVTVVHAMRRRAVIADTISIKQRRWASSLLPLQGQHGYKYLRSLGKNF